MLYKLGAILAVTRQSLCGFSSCLISPLLYCIGFNRGCSMIVMHVSTCAHTCSASGPAMLKQKLMQEPVFSHRSTCSRCKGCKSYVTLDIFSTERLLNCLEANQIGGYSERIFYTTPAARQQRAGLGLALVINPGSMSVQYLQSTDVKVSCTPFVFPEQMRRLSRKHKYKPGLPVKFLACAAVTTNKHACHLISYGSLADWVGFGPPHHFPCTPHISHKTAPRPQ